MLLKIAIQVDMLLRQDRGEGPVPYVIMVAIITGAALLVGTTIYGIANDWLGKIKTP